VSGGPSTDRATRLRLQKRLDLTRHAVELLRSKEEALRREATRLRGHARRTDEEWVERAGRAATWLLRARALGAGGGLTARPEPRIPATLELDWRGSMGVIYPGSVTCTAGAGPAPMGTAALGPATEAAAAALVAGARHAAATTALHRVEGELAVTGRRRRALERRLRPRLEAQLHRLDLALEERERDAALRTRLATRRPEARP